MGRPDPARDRLDILGLKQSYRTATFENSVSDETRTSSTNPYSEISMPTPAGKPDAEPERSPDSGRGLSGWQKLSFGLAHTLTAALVSVFSPSGLYRFGVMLGTLEWMINFKRRRRFHTMLAKILESKPTKKQRRYHCRAYFVRSRCDKLFYLVLDQLPQHQASELLTISNRDLLDRALERGCGVYITLAHHGAHHVIGLLMALKGYRTAGVRDRQEGGIRQFVQERFARRHPDLPSPRILFSDTYPRDIYRCFQDGLILGSAMDVSRVRQTHQRKEEVEIFGEKRGFITGPLRIAIRCKTPVLQAFLISEPNFHYRLEIVDTLIDPERDNTEEAAIAQVMQSYASNVEAFIRATPSLVTRI